MGEMHSYVKPGIKVWWEVIPTQKTIISVLWGEITNSRVALRTIMKQMQ